MDDTKQSESYEPAFPCFERIPDDESGVEHYGMSLRDYFAAKAMQAAATNPVGAEGFTFTQRAAWAYQQADAMLAERSKT